jgi:hypothetical protein
VAVRDVSAPTALPPRSSGTGLVPDVAPAAPPTDIVDQQVAAQRAFSTAILISAVRCLLTYILLPFVAPAVGLATGVGPVIGILIGLTAVTANGFTIRRFHRAGHRLRWAYTAVSGAVIVLLLVLMVQDIGNLL